jgi:hypothetical protein
MKLSRSGWQTAFVALIQSAIGYEWSKFGIAALRTPRLAMERIEVTESATEFRHAVMHR